MGIRLPGSVGLSRINGLRSAGQGFAAILIFSVLLGVPAWAQLVSGIVPTAPGLETEFPFHPPERYPGTLTSLGRGRIYDLKESVKSNGINLSPVYFTVEPRYTAAQIEFNAADIEGLARCQGEGR